MAKKKNAPRLEDVKFRATPRVREKSIFLGFASAKLVMPDGIAKGEDLVLYLNSIQVKIVAGKPRIDLHQEERNGRWYATAAPGSAATRALLTELIFADELVAATAQCVQEDAAAVA